MATSLSSLNYFFKFYCAVLRLLSIFIEIGLPAWTSLPGRAENVAMLSE